MMRVSPGWFGHLNDRRRLARVSQTSQPKSFSGLIGVALLTLALGAGSSKADVIDFGTFATPAGCHAAASGDAGKVCPSGEIFANGNLNVTANGYNGAPGTSTLGLLTFKPVTGFPGAPPNNGPDEGGLGENPNSSPTRCHETGGNNSHNCEISGNASVAVFSNNGTALDDLIVGSVQSTENFQLWTGSSLATLSTFEGVMNMSTCTHSPLGSDTCEFDSLPAGTEAIAVQGAGTGDIILIEVSSPSGRTITTPEPASLALFATALLVFGMVRRRRPQL